MEFEKHFESLDRINEAEGNKDNKLKNNCCQLEENHNLLNDMIECRVCKNIITNIVSNAEWKYYGSGNINSQDPTRCGMPVNSLLPESSVGSSVSFKNNNASMNQIRRYQQWQGMPYKERSLYKVYMNISEKCISADLPKIISETAQSYYRNISETKISRGSNRIGIIAACIYYSCKECGVPRSTSELSSLFDIDSKVMTKGCKNFTEITRISKDRKRIQSQKSVNLHDFTERFCHKLNIGISHQDEIKKLSKLCESLDLVNDNTPPAMASGCIYLYIRHNNIEIDKRNISDICKISEVTINKCAKKIEGNKVIKVFLEQVSFD